MSPRPLSRSILANAACALAACALLACGPSPGTTDGGARVDAGPRPDAGGLCGVPDESCPAFLPHPGAPCASGLSCDYPEENGSWMYTCPAGRWEASSTCDAPPGGACPIPPLAESCGDPFAGTLSGATVEIGPPGSGDFRPFTAGEMIDPIFGGQGSPMIQYRVRVAGAEAPSCVRTITTLSTAITEPVSDPRTVVLRCGESLGIFSVVASADMCPDAPVEVTLEVELSGIGSATATVTVPGYTFCALRG